MGTDLDHARQIAERVARRVAVESQSTPERAHAKAEVGAELAAVRAGINELQRKLAQLESKVSLEAGDRQTHVGGATERSPVPTTHSPWLAGVNASLSHASQEKFGVEEAVVAELVNFFEQEKICSIEPGAKPCDHCAMCSSRGF